MGPQCSPLVRKATKGSVPPGMAWGPGVGGGICYHFGPEVAELQGQTDPGF